MAVEEKRTFHKGTSQISPQTTISLEYDTSGLHPEAIKELNDYFIRIGRSVESTRILNEEKAERMRKLREDSYHDLKTILKNYRGFRRAHKRMSEEFRDLFVDTEVVDENGQTVTRSQFNIEQKSMPFTAIAQKLELLSVTEEKKFVTTYFPQISTMQRMEVAMEAVDSAIIFYSIQKPTYADIIRDLYLEGELKPTNEEIMNKYGYSEPRFYKIVNSAIEDISSIMFGGEDRTHVIELRSICAQFALSLDEISFFWQ